MENPRLLKAKLSQRGVHCSLDWVTACLEWLEGDQPGLSQAEAVLRLQEQWTLTDISVPGVMDRPVLPPDLAGQTRLELTGQFSLQVLHGHDISLPAYGQLQKLHNVDLENARVSADDSQASQLGGGGYLVTQGQYKKPWEPPRPQRSLMLTVTDGFQTVEAMEVEPVSCLPEVITPGCKIQVLGPVTVRRGIISLKNNTVRMLGGEVEELQEEFCLQKILQQKIGKDDVGQKQKRFAPVTSRDASAPAPRSSVNINPNLPQLVDVPQNTTSNNLPQEFFTDDDDDMLLLAASQTDHLVQQVGQNVASASSTSSSSIWDRNKGHKSEGSLPPPVGVVQPLRTITNVTEQGQDQTNKKMIAQSSITSFMTSKPKEPAEDPAEKATFSLMDSDDEFLTDFEDKNVKPQEILVPCEPFQYLTAFNERVQSSPDEIITGKFKVASTSVASKICVKQSSTDPKWHMMILVNDGSDSIKVELSPHILDKEIGSAAKFTTCKDPAEKAQYKENIKKFGLSLMSLNSIVTIQSSGEQGQVARIVEMEDISGKHFAALIKRSKMY